MIKSIISFFAFILIVWLLVNYVNRGTTTLFYATYNEAASSGIIKDGWLPEFLPASTTDINIKYRENSQQVWASFKYKLTDLNRMNQACTSREPFEHFIQYQCHFGSNIITIKMYDDGEADLESKPNLPPMPDN